MTAETRGSHILTVAVEDYFQVGAFNKLVQSGRWYRFETRVERNTRLALDLLDETGARATFFTLGWIADEIPEVVREIAERGHEVASKGYYHRSIRAMTPGEFREDLVRSREALEKACGHEVVGYRVADDWFQPEDLWALDVLAAEGFAYDSSICPMFRVWAHEPWRRFAHRHRVPGGGRIWELPLSTASVLGQHVPIAGGNYFRQFPHGPMKRAFRRWTEERPEPFVMYFQVWELDPGQPMIQAASWLTRIRHYRNLGKLSWVLRDYLADQDFTGVAERLGIERATLEEGEVSPSPEPPERIEVAPSNGEPVTIIVPCYNEELVLPYLARTLERVQEHLAGQYRFRYVFVDDCSSDGTLDALQEIFGDRPECRIVRHSRNRGVAQAILTGLEATETEIVASIDCDCTYDPHQLGELLPAIRDADLVTASPYHPEGEVRNVPEWRLFLSKGLSGLYRMVLHTKLATYTSCFRVYRRSVMRGMPIREGGFLGVAETLGLADLAGARVVETPAVLEVRMLGRSKMKVIRTILGHLKLLGRLTRFRVAPPSYLRARSREGVTARLKAVESGPQEGSPGNE